jgi:hypothetical protein
VSLAMLKIASKEDDQAPQPPPTSLV